MMKVSESHLSESETSDEDPSDSESLKKALADDDNVLASLPYVSLKDEFLASIEDQREQIEATVKLLLGTSWCRLAVKEAWRNGSFNVAIPVGLATGRQVYLRIPLPYRIGEMMCPGNAEEKLRTEIATYDWISEHSSDVPIPTLLAFGLPDGTMFTHPTNTPFFQRTWWSLRRQILALLGYSVPIKHVRRKRSHSLGSGFLLISQAPGKMLALSWLEHCHNPAYRARLFRGMARIRLSMNATPLPRIGSLVLRPDDSINLCNRPLHLYFQMLENEGIPSGVPRNRTYAEVEAYLSDLLSHQDSKLRHQPNAVHDLSDGRRQLAALAAMRATMHLFIRPEFRDGPFFYTLTDLHQQNIFVDDEWNIQSIIDLEWAHAMPMEMQLPPFWLTSRPVDGIQSAADVAQFETVLDEYLSIYAEEERKRNGRVVQAAVQRDVYRRGSFWYFQAASVPKGMYNLFTWHVQPLFNKEPPDGTIFGEVFSRYWGFGAQELIDKKLQDKAAYVVKVREVFGDDGE